MDTNWTPADLPGLIFDSRIACYWQDSACTIPAIDGDPIGAITMPGGITLVQPEPMRRPTVRGGAPFFDPGTRTDDPISIPRQ